MTDDDLDPAEAARARRRDRDASAECRALMRPGMGKVFKQILDRQAREAADARKTAGAPNDADAREASAASSAERAPLRRRGKRSRR
jgi:hypothetical protein